MRVETIAGGRGSGDELLAGGVTAVLHEIVELLERLAATGEGGAIDLRSLPMAPGDHEHLRSALGEGEVSASFDALGPTRVRETGVAGVWWIEHRNAHGETLTELIEVTEVPEILAAARQDIGAAAQALRARLGVSGRDDETSR